MHAQLAALASDFLSQHAQLCIPPVSRAAIDLPIPALDLDAQQVDIEAELAAEGCSAEGSVSLARLYQTACARVKLEARRTLVATVREVDGTGAMRVSLRQQYVESLRDAWTGKYATFVRSCADRFLEEVRLARLRHASSQSSTSTSTPTPQEPGTFTEEVVQILHAAFAVSDTVSRAERRQLALVTGLTERQVLTWFANQRQRRPKKAAAAQRASPYASARHPSTAASTHSHRHHLPPVRTVSGSSSLSANSSASSLSLVSYADEHVSEGEDIELAYPTEAEFVKREEDATPLLPASAGASFASFASRFQVTPPHSSLSFPSFTPAPAPVQPMIDFTTATPVAPSFSFASHPTAFLPPPPQPDFLSSTFSATPSHAPSPPSPSLSATESYFSLSDTSASFASYAQPLAPVPTPFSLDFSVPSTGAAGGVDA
ncbi:hypothetical protein JCM10207_006332 [Rhodosporidiobolus poonsookiae]